MTTLPTVESYGRYSSSNAGANSLKMSIAGLEVYFSYETIIAFRGRNGLRVIKNQWQTTTGKHLNWIDGGNKKERLEPEQFGKELDAELVNFEIEKAGVGGTFNAR